MDGNGRWAKKRLMPRVAGHKAGVKATREVVENCVHLGIEALTLFAFSSENWKRPQKEVGALMELFLSSLKSEVSTLHKNEVRIRFIGERESFSEKLQRRIADAEALTHDNPGLQLVIAANYGGRWDIAQAVKSVVSAVKAGVLSEQEIDAGTLHNYTALSDLPDPDLFIRTGGEQRISNFLLWQMAYSELYFSDELWPDFDRSSLEKALNDFTCRQRRYGKTAEQIQEKTGA